MKFLGVLGFSLIILIIGILREESFLRFRKRTHGEDPKEHRKKGYISTIAIWVVATAVFAYFVFR